MSTTLPERPQGACGSPPAGSPGDAAAVGATPLRPPSVDLPAAPPRQLPIPRWIARLAALCAIVLVPWIIYLSMVLPDHARAAHYDLAWVGFDIGMFLVLAALAWSAARRAPATGPLAAVAATFLVIDAWFDVTTSSGQTRFAFALASAVLVEVPLAALCTWVAVNAERLRTRAYRRLWARAEYSARVAQLLAARLGQDEAREQEPVSR